MERGGQSPGVSWLAGGAGEHEHGTCSTLFMSSQSWSSRSTAISSRYTQRLGMPFPLFRLGSPGEWCESDRLRTRLLSLNRQLIATALLLTSESDSGNTRMALTCKAASKELNPFLPVRAQAGHKPKVMTFKGQIPDISTNSGLHYRQGAEGNTCLTPVQAATQVLRSPEKKMDPATIPIAPVKASSYPIQAVPKRP